MRKALITIQDNQFSETQIQQLDAILKDNYREHVSQEKLLSIWCHVPEGQAYTNYQGSQSSIITIECENNFSQPQREQMLKSCASQWQAITGQNSDQIMLALVEENLFRDLLNSNQQRLSSKGRMRMGMHMAAAMLSSKLARRPFSFNPNI